MEYEHVIRGFYDGPLNRASKTWSEEEGFEELLDFVFDWAKQVLFRHGAIARVTACGICRDSSDRQALVAEFLIGLVEAYRRGT